MQCNEYNISYINSYMNYIIIINILIMIWIHILITHVPRNFGKVPRNFAMQFEVSFQTMPWVAKTLKALKTQPTWSPFDLHWSQIKMRSFHKGQSLTRNGFMVLEFRCSNSFGASFAEQCRTICLLWWVVFIKSGGHTKFRGDFRVIHSFYCMIMASNLDVATCLEGWRCSH